MKKGISLFLCVALLVFSCQVIVFAEDTDDIQTSEIEIVASSSVHNTSRNSSESEENMQVTHYLKINNQMNPLYKVFADKEEAIENLKADAPNLLEFIQNNSEDLAPIEDSNWKTYRTNYFNLVNEIPSSLFDEEMAFRGYIDIRENDEKNEELLRKCDSKESLNKQELAFALPYNTPFYEKLEESNESKNVLRAGAQTFNKTAGINYANSHGPSGKWNSDGYEYLGSGDCTNFASQILEAGGIEQHYNWQGHSYDPAYGWWHSSGGWLGLHGYSYSWTLSDNFVRFMGHHNNTYSSFYELSRRVVSGDFIAYDGGADGDWDHVGFVTGTGTYNTYNGRYYRDFIVAQHTKDYVAWVSSDTNGWENLSYPVKFAIVRRNSLAGVV